MGTSLGENINKLAPYEELKDLTTLLELTAVWKTRIVLSEKTKMVSM